MNYIIKLVVKQRTSSPNCSQTIWKKLHVKSYVYIYIYLYQSDRVIKEKRQHIINW